MLLICFAVKPKEAEKLVDSKTCQIFMRSRMPANLEKVILTIMSKVTLVTSHALYLRLSQVQTEESA